MIEKKKLVDVCEPLFQYVCRLNRSARKNVNLDPIQVRSEVDSIFEGIRREAQETPGMAGLLEGVELPLIFFVDYMIKESDLSFAGLWEEIAKERGELGGDEKFFDLLENALQDRHTSSEQLAVFYVCMGLGFAGWYSGQPEFLRAKMDSLAARLRDQMDVDETARICADAYEHVDTSDLVRPPGRSLMGIMIILVGTVIVLIATNIALYQSATEKLNGSLDVIIKAAEDGGAMSSEGES